MIRIGFVTLTMLLLCVGASACKPSAQDSTKSSAEQEIRAALCEAEKRHYESAKRRLERLLESDPKNIDARKALLGIQAKRPHRFAQKADSQF